jgi:hypothetical protein
LDTLSGLLDDMNADTKMGQSMVQLCDWMMVMVVVVVMMMMMMMMVNHHHHQKADNLF